MTPLRRPALFTVAAAVSYAAEWFPRGLSCPGGFRGICVGVAVGRSGGWLPRDPFGPRRRGSLFSEFFFVCVCVFHFFSTFFIAHSPERGRWLMDVNSRAASAARASTKEGSGGRLRAGNDRLTAPDESPSCAGRRGIRARSCRAVAAN